MMSGKRKERGDEEEDKERGRRWDESIVGKETQRCSR